ncbi:MAG: hypothetical protein IJN13_00830 [Bacilli bacterium]|nr:hypothetical protein [Bacilli bacterium]
MKKKRIFIILILIALTLTILTSLCFGKNNNKTFIKDGVLFALTLDGLAISDFPERGDYSVEIDCDNAVGKWLPKEWKFVLENITGKVSCNLDFHSNPKSISEIVESYPKVKMSQSGYSTNMFYSTSYTSASGTNITNAFSFNNNEWSSIPSNLTSGRYYHLRMNVGIPGYYELCYTMSKGYSGNYLYLYNGSTRMTIEGLTFLKASPDEVKMGCVDLGYVSSYVKVTQRAYNSSTDGIAKLSFYLKGSGVTDQGDAGYRYAGTNPGNYVWFNNELWRIIGSIPTKVDSLGTTKNLVKIIRNDAIGSIAYDAKYSDEATGIWGNNTLYTLLNSYYYGAKNATSSSYCYVTTQSTKSICDYTSIGISPTEYYGKMVKKVYWNTGASSGVNFASEASNQTINAYVGLMTFSDLYYSSGGDTHEQWLNKYPYEWTSTAYASDTVKVYGTYEGSTRYYNPYNYRLAINMLTGMVARPVVYLDESVYIVSGDGTEINPYQLSM